MNYFLFALSCVPLLVALAMIVHANRLHDERAMTEEERAEFRLDGQIW